YVFGARRDWWLAAEVPFAHFEPRGTSPFGEATGLGSVRFVAGHLFARRSRSVQGAFVETLVNTASEPQLGAGPTLLAFSYGAAWRVGRKFDLTLIGSYQASVETELPFPKTRTAALRPILTARFPSFWYGSFDARVSWDFVREPHARFLPGILVGRVLGQKRNWALFASYGAPLDTFSRRNSSVSVIRVGMNRFFR
ncbi:MAG: hypothetical protein ACRD3M_02860, partial [Thermoanaerobaculia bacterium]